MKLNKRANLRYVWMYMDKRVIELLDKATDFQVDSRKIGPGSVFFALPGKKVNGTDFLDQVAKRGAIAALVPSEYRGSGYGLDLIHVQNVEECLQTLAKKSLNKEKVVGVTGSVGKTTTKEFIWQLVKDSIPAWRSPGNANSQIGLPLSLLNRDRSKELLIVEYGVSEKGDMSKLLQIVKPTLGVITKICGVHLEGLGDIAGVLQEKGRLVTAAKKGVFPFSLKEGLRGVCVGKGGDYWLEKELVCEKGKKVKVDLPFSEEHFIQNMLTAFAVGRELGIESEVLAKRCSFLKTGSMRFEKLRKKGMLIIKDMYNASEESMKMALANLPKSSKGRVIGVLGQMAELGTFSEKMHFSVGEFARDKLDILLVLGKGASEINRGFKRSKKPSFHYLTKDGLIEKLKKLARPEDVILIKGSRFLQMEDIYQEVFDTP